MGEVVTDAASAVSEIVESVIAPKAKAAKGTKKENGAAKTKKAASPRTKK
jgi:hypothetical protein